MGRLRERLLKVYKLEIIKNVFRFFDLMLRVEGKAQPGVVQ
jgi:hypothetical protein